MNYKSILIGQLIEWRVKENGTEISRICSFFECDEADILKMYQSENLSTDLLLKWCKILEYDFFRIYSQHLILYAPSLTNHVATSKKQASSKLPYFRKNIYTREVIDFIVNKIVQKEMTKLEVMDRYSIPKTTLYKWIVKYSETKV